MPRLTFFRIILIILALPIVTFLAFELYFFNAAYPNLRIGDIDVGGKSRRQIEEILKKETEFRQNKVVIVSVNKSNYASLKLTKELVTYNISETANEVIAYGRTGSINERMQERLNLWNGPRTIKPVYTFDSLTFDTLLADELRQYEKPIIETELIYTVSGPVLTPSKPGTVVNRDKATRAVEKYLDFKGVLNTIALQTENKNPKVTRENSQEVLELARRAVSRPITLYSPKIADRSWTLDGPQLFDFLEVKYNEAYKKPTLIIADYKVASYSGRIAPLVKKDVKEAKYETIGNKVVVIEPSASGQELDTEKLTQQLSWALFSPSQNSRIDLPIKTIEPALAANTVNQYGIREVIASGTTHFQGSSDARIHNIETAAEKLNGTVIKPGEVFSMYRAIGNIEKSTGFEDSYIIKNGRTVVGVGGGVCQVSTTLYRAALSAGFKINERHPHSYRVKYYEQDAPPGLDAAIFFPTADFKFTNNTDNVALIQTQLDKKNFQLTFNIYGVKDGRTVEISHPDIRNRVAPPKEVRIQSTSVPKGIIRQTEYAAEGSDIYFSRKVTKNGKELINETVKTHYYPWQAVFLIGTKEN